MFELKELKIPGCFEIQPRVQDDLRGSFVKVFHMPEFKTLGLNTEFVEEYYSHSKRGVIRGMHFQNPPSDHVKLVYCVRGEVQDVVLDLRQGSPTFGQTVSVFLSESKGNCIYIPKGLAHGFCVISETATLIYKVSTVYNPNCDSGIHWSSVDCNWKVTEPILSERDKGFPTIDKYPSPFVYEK